VRSKAGS